MPQFFGKEQRVSYSWTRGILLCEIVLMIFSSVTPCKALNINLNLDPERNEEKEGTFNFESEKTLDFEFPSTFILTSSYVDKEGGIELMSQFKKLNPRIKQNQDCIRLDLTLPSDVLFDPLLICLQPFDWKKSVFHPNFSFSEHLPGGQIKVTTLDELKVQNQLVKGFVVLFLYGQSFIQGQIKNGIFYGTVLFSQPGGRSGFKMCSVAPLTEIQKFLQNTKNNFDNEEDLEDLIITRTRIQKMSSKIKASFTEAETKPTSIVTCEGRSVNQKIKKDLDFDAILKSRSRSRKRKRSTSGSSVKSNESKEKDKLVLSRQKRDPDPDDPPADAINPTNPKPSSDDPADPNAVQIAGKTGKSLNANSKGGILLSDERNFKYLTVYFYVDPRVIREQFGNDASQLVVALSSYVEMTDWVTRAHDFTGDGKPDNFGFKFSQAVIGEEYTAKDPGPEIYKRLRQFQMENFYETLVGANHKKAHSVNIAIVPIDNPLYLHLAMNKDHDFLYDGCTACSTANILDGLINPKAERYDANGEVIRMMYATMHILIASIVYTKSDRSCMECTDLDQWVEADGGDAWGACLVEGMLFDSSNIPLNAFRLSKCSQATGQKCIGELGDRNINAEDGVAETCLKIETEDTYCGNGIVEPGEECDCGTLAMCDLEKCSCGPRNDVLPCMKLTSTESQFCQDLIKCRGYRFISEMGQLNGSHFLASVPALLRSRVLPSQSQGIPVIQSNNFNNTIVIHFLSVLVTLYVDHFSL